MPFGWRRAVREVFASLDAALEALAGVDTKDWREGISAVAKAEVALDTARLHLKQAEMDLRNVSEGHPKRRTP